MYFHSKNNEVNCNNLTLFHKLKNHKIFHILDKIKVKNRDGHYRILEFFRKYTGFPTKDETKKYTDQEPPYLMYMCTAVGGDQNKEFKGKTSIM